MGESASRETRSGNFNGINGFALKLTAIIAMTCNHVANVFATQLPGPLLLALYSLGGLTFPIMAFLLVEGFCHTSNLRKYALRLFLFALVSQIPYSLLWGAVPNVLFTLLAGLAVLWVRKKLGDGIPSIAALLAAIALTISFDWRHWRTLDLLVPGFSRAKHIRWHLAGYACALRKYWIAGFGQFAERHNEYASRQFRAKHPCRCRLLC